MKKTILAIAAVSIVGLACAISGCETLEPDSVTLDGSHTSHHYGSAPWDYGADTAGLSEHWHKGRVSVDLAEFGRHDKAYGGRQIDGWEPEFSAAAHVSLWSRPR